MNKQQKQTIGIIVLIVVGILIFNQLGLLSIANYNEIYDGEQRFFLMAQTLTEDQIYSIRTAKSTFEMTIPDTGTVIFPATYPIANYDVFMNGNQIDELHLFALEPLIGQKTIESAEYYRAYDDSGKAYLPNEPFPRFSELGEAPIGPTKIFLPNGESGVEVLFNRRAGDWAKSIVRVVYPDNSILVNFDEEGIIFTESSITFTGEISNILWEMKSQLFLEIEYPTLFGVSTKTFNQEINLPTGNSIQSISVPFGGELTNNTKISFWIRIFDDASNYYPYLGQTKVIDYEEGRGIVDITEVLHDKVVIHNHFGEKSFNIVIDEGIIIEPEDEEEEEDPVMDEPSRLIPILYLTGVLIILAFLIFIFIKMKKKK